jgi:hypothetical protein
MSPPALDPGQMISDFLYPGEVTTLRPEPNVGAVHRNPERVKLSGDDELAEPRVAAGSRVFPAPQSDSGGNPGLDFGPACVLIVTAASDNQPPFPLAGLVHV